MVCCVKRFSLCTSFHGTYWQTSRTVGPFTQDREAHTVHLGKGLQTHSPGEGWVRVLLAWEAGRIGGPIPLKTS